MESIDEQYSFQVPIYDVPGDRLLAPDDHLHLLRNAFYRALYAVRPEALQDLRETCLEALERVPVSVLATTDPGKLHTIEPLSAPLEKWARKHWLVDPWLMDDAVSYLLGVLDAGSCWQPVPETLNAQFGEPLAEARNTLDVIRIPGVELSVRVPLPMPRQALQKHLVARFKQQIKAELDRIESLSKSTGAVLKNLPSLDEHMAWLVRFQVLGESPSEIAKSRHGRKFTESSVHEAIDRAASSINLGKRPARPAGRPRGN